MKSVIITGEFPPQRGGVSDYTAQVAGALAARGHDVEVWAPPFPGEPSVSLQAGVRVHRLADRFSWRGLPQLRRACKELPAPTQVLVQYVPQAFGFMGMNVAFCLWLWTVSRRHSLSLMFHEVATPWASGKLGWRWLFFQGQAAVTRCMAALLGRCARRLYVSVHAWGPLLRGFGVKKPTIWLPVPATIALDLRAQSVRARRSELLGAHRFLIGHFGTFGGHVAELLRPMLVEILEANPEARVVLMGRGSVAFGEALKRDFPGALGRLLVTGGLEPEAVAESLAACDLVVQPYIDGISSRRTSSMASLALGVPLVTNLGFLSEPLWAGTDALAAVDAPAQIPARVHGLLRDAAERLAMGERGAAFYREHFDLERVVGRLLNDARQDLDQHDL